MLISQVGEGGREGGREGGGRERGGERESGRGGGEREREREGGREGGREGEREREYVCGLVHIGFQHIPVGPLSPQMEQLAALASMSDGDVKQKGSPEVGVASSAANTSPSGSGHVSGSGHMSGRGGGQQVKAFSGKGHTLSSSGAAGELRPATDQQDPILHAARVVTEKALTSLREKESRLQQQVSSCLVQCFASWLAQLTLHFAVVAK